MTNVEGQVESLARLKETLSRNGITRFSSLGDLDRFIKNYEKEREQLPRVIESALETELQRMHSALARQQKIYDELKAEAGNRLTQEAQELEDKISKARDKRTRNILYRILYCLLVEYLSHRKSALEHDFEEVVKEKTTNEESKVTKLTLEITDLLKNKRSIIAERCKKSLDDLIHTKAVVDGLHTLIAGAIGESAVVKTLQQLTDEFYLFNDFSLDLDPPIYNKNESDRIFSIQIDHLLVGRSGVFLLETKNWSRHSLDNLDLRSPVKQILRTSFALFVLLNSDSRRGGMALEQHHWGSKKIPIRNIVVMINEKPRAEFKHVKVLSLSELNGYIQYFERVFSAKEVEVIVENLRSRMRART